MCGIPLFKTLPWHPWSSEWNPVSSLRPARLCMSWLLPAILAFFPIFLLLSNPRAFVLTVPSAYDALPPLCTWLAPSYPSKLSLPKFLFIREAFHDNLVNCSHRGPPFVNSTETPHSICLSMWFCLLHDVDTLCGWGLWFIIRCSVEQWTYEPAWKYQEWIYR